MSVTIFISCGHRSPTQLVAIPIGFTPGEYLKYVHMCFNLYCWYTDTELKKKIK